MNDRERRAAKYLPFDSLKGLKEAIDLEDHKSNGKLKLPTITEEEKLQNSCHTCQSQRCQLVNPCTGWGAKQKCI